MISVSLSCTVSRDFFQAALCRKSSPLRAQYTSAEKSGAYCQLPRATALLKARTGLSVRYRLGWSPCPQRFAASGEAPVGWLLIVPPRESLDFG